MTRPCAQDALPEKQVKTFADVKGCPDAKAELEEVVAFLKHPDRFTRHAFKHHSQLEV